MSYTVKKGSDRTLRELAQFGVRNQNLTPNAVRSTNIVEEAVKEKHIEDKAVTGNKVADAAIDTAHIRDAAITDAKIANATIGSAKIQDASITSAKIAGAAIGAAQIQEGSIDTANIKDGAITSAKIADASIDTAHIKDAAIDTAKIKDAAITEAKIGDLTADKIKAGTLTVTDQAGTGASAISIKSGVTEKVRLDKDGITVNDGNIVVRSPAGATMISGEGINVNEFTTAIAQSYNLIKNSFFKYTYKGELTLPNEIYGQGSKTGENLLARGWNIIKEGEDADLRVSFETQPIIETLEGVEYSYTEPALSVIYWPFSAAASGRIKALQRLRLWQLDREKYHTLSLRYYGNFKTYCSLELGVIMKDQIGTVLYTKSTVVNGPLSMNATEKGILSLYIPPLETITTTSSGSIEVYISINNSSDSSNLHVECNGIVLEQGLRVTETAYENIFDDVGMDSGSGGLDALIGVPLPWPDTTPPAWAFPADGRYLNPNSFPKLFERYSYRFGYQYQTVDGISVKFFRIPELRKEFIRGWDDREERELGSWQEDAFGKHQHQTPGESYRAPWGTSGSGSAGRWNGSVSSKYALTSPMGGPETRPRNVAFLYIIPFMSIPLGSGGQEVNLETIDVLVNYKPKYISEWFYVTKAQTYTKAHGLGVHPSNVRLQFSPVVAPGANEKIVNLSGNDLGAYGATVAFDATNVYVYFAGAQVFDAVDGNNSRANPPFGAQASGYARILAWE